MTKQERLEGDMYLCSVCGSDKIQLQEWVEINSGKLHDAVDDSPVYCPDCGKITTAIDAFDYYNPKLEKIWDFVEKYYPNYDGCPEIQLNNDLHKIMHKEIIGETKVLLEERYNNNIGDPQIIVDYAESSIIIYRKSIEVYIKRLKD